MVKLCAGLYFPLYPCNKQMKSKTTQTFINILITLLLLLCVLWIDAWITAFEVKSKAQFQLLIPYLTLSGLSELLIASLFVVYFWAFNYRNESSISAAILAVVMGVSLLFYNILAHQSDSLNMSSRLLPNTSLFTTGAFIFATGGFNLLRQRFFNAQR